MRHRLCKNPSRHKSEPRLKKCLKNAFFKSWLQVDYVSVMTGSKKKLCKWKRTFAIFHCNSEIRSFGGGQHGQN